MGGRSSYFKVTSGRSKISENFSKNYYNEQYTKKPTKYTDQLKDETNQWVMDSTDRIVRENINAQTQFLSTLSKKFKGATELLDDKNILKIRSMPYSRSSTAAAAFISPGGGAYEMLQIVFNENKMNRTLSSLSDAAKYNIDKGFWSHSDKGKEIFHVIAHEYGHFIEKTLVEKEMQKAGKSARQGYINYDSIYENYSKQFTNEIKSIKQSKFDDNSSKRVSGYANLNYPENFAEVFAHLATTKKPNNWGKAMKIFLKEKGIL